MKSRLLAATAVMLMSFLSSGTTEAQTVYRTYVPPQPGVWRVVSPSTTILPAPIVSDRSVTISESAPIRLSPPMSGTVLHYERPLTESVVFGTSTRITAPAATTISETAVPKTVVSETKISEKSIISVPAASTPEPLLSGGEDLKPLLPRRLPLPESESEPKTETVAKPLTKSEPKPIKTQETLETPEIEAAVEKPEKETPPIRDLVATERTDTSREKENIFKDIMTSRELAVPARVAKPPKPLPPVASSPVDPLSPPEPNPVATMKIESLPVSEPEPVSTLVETKKPPEPPSRELLRGQSGSRNMVDDILIEPPPYPEGPADPGEIDHKLLDSATIVPGPLDMKDFHDKSDKNKPGSHRSRSKAEDQWVGGALLLTTIIASMVACYAVVLAFEFRQRWLQSVTEQNNRFTLGYDDEMFMGGGYNEETGHYGDMPLYGKYLDDAGSDRFRPEILEPSMRY